MRRVWAKDAELLVKIGRELDKQKAEVTVTLPRKLATAAARSWDRDYDENADFDATKKETPSQRRLRHRSGTLSLIGNSVKLQRPRGRKNRVRVTLHVWFIADALRAFYDED